MVTWLCRIIIGAVFVFSGFVKAIDPWGTLYKFDEYLAALNLPVLHTLLLTGVFGLCALEFLLGIFMVFGCYRKSAPALVLAVMCVMLPLTLWVAVKNPVSDCGCFGDAFVISNWATFWKNVVLTAMAVWLVRFNRREPTVISPAFQWMGVVVSLGFVLMVALRGYLNQPMLDFRPYHIGQPLISSHDDSGSDDNFKFIYEKNGVKKEFGVDDVLPSEEEGWKFVERVDIMPDSSENTTGDSRTFRLWDKEGKEDVTDEVIDADHDYILVLMPDLGKVSPAMTWKINALNDWAVEHKMELIAVASGTPEQISEWEDLSMPGYDIYTCDDTAIKEVARGNPSVVWLNHGTIGWKYTLESNELDPISSDSLNITPDALRTDTRQILVNWVWIYLACMSVLVAVSMLPRLKGVYERRVTHDDTAPREE